MFEWLKQDIRFALRQWQKNPGFTAVAVLMLAIGIGSTSAIFSLIWGAVWGALPYEHGDRLVVLRQEAPLRGVEDMGFSVAEIHDYQDQTRTLDDVVEYHTMWFNLLGHGEPRRVQTGVVSANFFELLGIKPLLGRTIGADDDALGAEPVLVLSHKFWKEQMAGDPNIVGATFEMNDHIHTVVGVLPPVPQYPNENDVYMPTSACPFRSNEGTIANRNARMLDAFARLKPGVQITQARADLATIANRMESEHPDNYPSGGGFTSTALSLKEELIGDFRTTLWILSGTVLFVLIIVCANVANLSLARMVRREREMLLRTVLGAGRGRLIRQLLTESVMLALLGGGLGLLLAYGTLGLLTDFAARFTARAGEIRIDGTVLSFTVLVSVLTGLLFGAMPAFLARHNLASAMRESSTQSTSASGPRRARNLLTVLQLAVSLMLLVGAGLMVRSMLKLQHVDPGFDVGKVLTMELDLDWSKYRDANERRAFYQAFLPKVKAVPGVKYAAVAATFPLNERPPGNLGVMIENRPVPEGQAQPSAEFRMASEDYFSLLGIRVVQGRTFTIQDNESAPPVVVISNSMANRYWPDGGCLGQRLSVNGGRSWPTVIGVVADVKQHSLATEAQDELYLPLAQQPILGGNLLVATEGDPASLSRPVRDALYSIDPQQPVSNIRTLAQIRDESLASPRLTTTLLALCAGLALLLTVMGISGLLAYSVSERTQEIGIRMALGADRFKVLALVMRQGMLLVLLGVVLGTLVSLALAQVMSGLVFGVEVRDPLTFVAVALVLLTASAVACFVPARRATDIDPNRALRAE